MQGWSKSWSKLSLGHVNMQSSYSKNAVGVEIFLVIGLIDYDPVRS